MTSPNSVRLAMPYEARDIARIQQAVYAEPRHPAHTVADRIDVAELADVWERSITRPPRAENRVLVALGETGAVVGFVATGASADQDARATTGTVVEFAVDPAARRQGHGTRLVHAAVDTLRADRFAEMFWWVLSTDDALRGLLTEMVFATDGAHQELQSPDGAAAKYVRLRTRIDEA